ncbi:MAG: penicillin acylase family protein [Candidatus Hydrogenedens sp.]
MWIYSFSICSVIYAQGWTETYWEQLEIYKDDYGIPHIFSKDIRALGFGFGYVQAQDHWESMLLSYRLANGKLSEVLGAGEEASDRFSIQAGHRYYGMLAYNNCDSTTRELCDGFAEGVNSWILENRDKLPEWVDGIQPQDIFSLWHAFIVSLAPIDIPNFPKRPPGIKTGFAFSIASEKSRANTPIFALSSHQFYQGPFRWYEAHLICGDYNVYGCTLYGLPILIQGHSLKHAWALTPNQSDFADVFIENPLSNSARNTKSMLNMSNRSDEKSMLLLQYMSQSDVYYVKTLNGLEQRFVPVHITSRGPLLVGPGNEFFTWKIGGYEDIGAFFQLWEMGRSSSLEKFKQAVYLHQLPCFHILYMDNSNQSYYFYSTKVGLREPPPGFPSGEMEQIRDINWTTPVPSKFYPVGWRYLVSPELLPHIQNPVTGYMQICGGPPDSITDDIKISNQDFSAKYIKDIENVVSRRIRSVLRTDKRSLREVQSLLLEDLSCLAVEVVPRILNIANSHGQELSSFHPDLPLAVQLLNNWNLRMTTEGSAPVVFNLWSHFFSKQSGIIPSIEIEPFYSLMNKNKEMEGPCLEALVNAVRYLKNNRNSININWGEVHRLQRGAEEYSLGGSEIGGSTFLLSEIPPDTERWGQITYGIGFALVAKLGNTIESYSVQPFGNSESVQSIHYKDQWDLFRNRQMKRTRFYPEDIYRFAEQGIGRRLVFIPPGGVGEIRCISSSRIFVSMKAMIEPPIEIPEGMFPFSVFIKPQCVPKEANVQFAIRLYIPNDICAPENISQLSLYYYDDSSGWVRSENQNSDSIGGFIEGILERAFLFVILGPKEVAILNPEETSVRLDGKQTNTIGQGIFSPGLPGEIPTALKKKGNFFFSIQGEQKNNTLPKPIDLPVIRDKNTSDQLEQTNNGDKISESEKQKDNTNRTTEKDKKKGKITSKDIQPKQIKKNFSIKK